MKVLFDHGTPVPLRRHLPGHEISTAYEMGWAKLSNGDLLAAAEKSYAAFITTDQNLRYQQNLAGRKLAIAVFNNHQLAGNSKAHGQSCRMPEGTENRRFC